MLLLRDYERTAVQTLVRICRKLNKEEMMGRSSIGEAKIELE